MTHGGVVARSPIGQRSALPDDLSVAIFASDDRYFIDGGHVRPPVDGMDQKATSSEPYPTPLTHSLTGAAVLEGELDGKGPWRGGMGDGRNKTGRPI